MTREMSFLQLSSRRSQKKLYKKTSRSPSTRETRFPPTYSQQPLLLLERERELCTRFSPLDEAEEPVIVVVKKELRKRRKQQQKMQQQQQPEAKEEDDEEECVREGRGTMRDLCRRNRLQRR